MKTKDKKTLADYQIKTLRREAKARLPDILQSIKSLMNTAERNCEATVAVPIPLMKHVFSSLALAAGTLGVKPFDWDPTDALGFDTDPKDPVPGVDSDPKDRPAWDFDSKDP